MGDRVFGCLYSTGKPYLLGGGDCDTDGLGGVGAFRLLDRYVAYSATTCNIDQAKAHVRVRNLRTGAKPIVVDASPSFRDMLDIGRYFVSDLELKANGSVAWIVKLDIEGVPRIREVRKTDGTVAKNAMGFRDQSVLLDSGDQIDSRSLALSGLSLSWTNGGMGRSASVR
ncbi:MAG: hypothetical protein ACR2ML_00335 [Solirubrobacteraceae bacterium]